MSYWILSLVCLVALAVGCGGYEFSPLSDAEIQARMEKVQSAPDVPVEANEVAVLSIICEGNDAIPGFSGTITFKFHPDVAPNHCMNFKKLANNGFYDGTLFHRVIPGFMIQGGDINSTDTDPANDGSGNPGYTVNAEFSQMPHKRGIVSMARSAVPNSAGSQFFICHAAANHLDGQYSVFGEVIEGMDIVDKIATVPTSSSDTETRPLVDIRMTEVRVAAR